MVEIWKQNTFINITNSVYFYTMTFGLPPYYPSIENVMHLPLERYLPPYQQNVLVQMLKYKDINEGWLLDPIGSNPLSAIELANVGYRVMVACNNPILAKLYEVICRAPVKNQFQAALSEFGSFKVGDERLELQIRKIYQTECPNCRSTNDNADFLWKKGEDTPFQKELLCTSCKLKSESPISEQDLLIQSSIGNLNLYRSRAFQRVIPGVETPPPVVQEVIQAYLPRSLAVLSKLLNRNDAYNTTAERKSIIEALLILACDFGTMLWGNPPGRSRPKAISIPNQFWEYNLWKILENGSKFLTFFESPIPFTIFPELPSETGGICLYTNRIRRREDFQSFPNFQAVTTILPRPNQALWAFSAVWAGWIWGHSAVQKLKGSLERKRYDWIWHTNALQKLFEFTSTMKTPWIATAPEISPNFMLSFVSAPAASGYRLDEYSYSPEQKSAQLYFSYDPGRLSKDQIQPNFILEYLERKGEQASYQELSTINILNIARNNNLEIPNHKVDISLFTQIQQNFEKKLKNNSLFKKIDKDTFEFGEFWLANPPNNYRPLADQIEISLIQYLQIDPIVSVLEIETIIDKKQPGILPASHDLIVKLLESYCDPVPGMEETWQLRKQETSNIRQADIRIMKNMLINIGNKIGMKVINNANVVWETPDKNRNYHFFVTGSCILSRFISQDLLEKKPEIVIVYPGSRAELLSYKIKRDPIFAEQLTGFHLVKYRHLRNINDIPGLDLQTWEKLIDSDPAIWQEFGQPLLF